MGSSISKTRDTIKSLNLSENIKKMYEFGTNNIDKLTNAFNTALNTAEEIQNSVNLLITTYADLMKSLNAYQSNSPNDMQAKIALLSEFAGVISNAIVLLTTKTNDINENSITRGFADKARNQLLDVQKNVEENRNKLEHGLNSVSNIVANNTNNNNLNPPMVIGSYDTLSIDPNPEYFDHGSGYGTYGGDCGLENMTISDAPNYSDFGTYGGYMGGVIGGGFTLLENFNINNAIIILVIILLISMYLFKYDAPWVSTKTYTDHDYLKYTIYATSIGLIVLSYLSNQ